MKLVKIKRTLCAALALCGFALMLGTAGASDAGNIEFGDLIVQAVVGIALFGGGMFGAR